MTKNSLRLAILAGLFAGSSVAGGMTKLELRSGIQFDAPAGTRLVEGAGTDSMVGKLVGPHFTCSYDIGLHANPLTSVPKASISEVKLAGRKARVIAEGDAADGLHVEKVGRSVLGDVNMTLYCTSETDAARQAVRAMFRTLTLS